MIFEDGDLKLITDSNSLTIKEWKKFNNHLITFANGRVEEVKSVSEQYICTGADECSSLGMGQEST